jgi:hypothetical protein
MGAHNDGLEKFLRELKRMTGVSVAETKESRYARGAPLTLRDRGRDDGM